MDEKDVCPICFEEYRNPKILPCRHSFCRHCLESLVLTENRQKKTKQSHFLCPNCRFKIQIPPDGLNVLLSNYFIRSLPDITNCEYCGTECRQICLTCETCMRKTCPSCFNDHGKNNQCNKLDEKSDTPGDLYRALMCSRTSIKTVYEGCISTSFQNRQDDQIVKLVPSVFGERMWMLHKHSRVLVECDRSGKTINRINVSGKILDFCTHKGNSMLVTYENSKVVTKVTQSEESVFCHHEHGYPRYVTFMRKIFIVVAVKVTNNILDEFQLYFYNFNGDRLIEYPCKSFKHISGLCSNAVGEQICISDRKLGRVFLVSSDHKHYTYFGSRRLTICRRRRDHVPKSSQKFDPACVTCDEDGNVFMFDDISGLIHIVNQRANLVALMDTIEDHYVESSHMTFSGAGQLWISDTQDRTIKVYNVENIVNRLDVGIDSVLFEANDSHDRNGENVIEVSAELLENMQTFAMMQHEHGELPADFLESFRNFLMRQGSHTNNSS